jgi:cell division transport system permease protein
MTRSIRLFRFAVGEGIRGLGRAKLSTSAAVTVLAAALTLFGVFLGFSLQLETQLATIARQADLKVVLAEKTDEKVVLRMQKQLAQLPGINTVTYVSKAEAAAILQEQHALDVQDLVGFNPLPASFDLTVDDAHWPIATMDSLIGIISNLNQVEEVIYDKNLWAKITQLRGAATMIVGVVGLVLLLTGAFVVGNTIRLTIYARRDVLRIMQLLGATRGFIRRPFLVEGLLQGTMAALISIGALHVFWEFLALITGIAMAPPLLVYGFLLISGWGLGFIGAIWTLRRFLP